jgi:uncharacterized protein YbjQ (UPF0145 family)
MCSRAPDSGAREPSEEIIMENRIWVSTTNEFEGFRVRQYMGIVRGITVRSRSIIGSFGAGLQQLVGGNISLYTEMCEEARLEAYELMVRHAADMGANAVLGMRYDTTEIGDGVAEVLAYGTAVIIDRIPSAA